MVLTENRREVRARPIRPSQGKIGCPAAVSTAPWRLRPLAPFALREVFLQRADAQPET